MIINFNAGEKQGNPHNIYAVAILKSGVVVGHIPPKSSSICSSRSELIMLVNIPYIPLNHENHEFFFLPPPFMNTVMKEKKEGVCDYCSFCRDLMSIIYTTYVTGFGKTSRIARVRNSRNSPFSPAK